MKNPDIVELVSSSALNVRTSSMLARVHRDERITSRALALIRQAAELLDEAMYEIETRSNTDWIRDYERVKS